MAVCPDCAGAKRVFRFLDGRREDGTAFHSSGYADCSRCAGTGEVSQEDADRYAAGQVLRRDRLHRMVSLREEAARLGITPSELSKRERGKT